MTCERCGTPLHAGRCPRCGPYARVPASWAPGGAVRGDERRSAMVSASSWTVAFGVVVLLGTYLVASIARSHHIESALNSPDYSAGPHPPPPYMLLLLAPGVLCWAACGWPRSCSPALSVVTIPRWGRWHGCPFPRSLSGSAVVWAASTVSSARAGAASPWRRSPSSARWSSSPGRCSRLRRRCSGCCACSPRPSPTCCTYARGWVPGVADGSTLRVCRSRRPSARHRRTCWGSGCPANRPDAVTGTSPGASRRG